MPVTAFPALILRLSRGLVLFASLVAASGASALSIGEIELRSRIGEPLHAVVPLGNLGTLAQGDIIVSRATDADYRANGVDRAAFSAPLRFDLRVDAKGNASIDVSTEKPVSEPFVDMVLEVRWPTGRAVRQFTLLLDLPPR
jgi:pilus assembly protein FimV